jgi:hypothetical protein
MAVSRSLAVPESYSGWLYYLLLIPIFSLVLGFLALIATLALGQRGGVSGVPAALVALPAFYFLSPGILIVELMSLRGTGKAPKPPKIVNGDLSQ